MVRLVRVLFRARQHLSHKLAAEYYARNPQPRWKPSRPPWADWTWVIGGVRHFSTRYGPPPPGMYGAPPDPPPPSAAESTAETEQQRINDDQAEARRQESFRRTRRVWSRIQQERAEQRAGAGYKESDGTWVSARRAHEQPPRMYGTPPEPAKPPPPPPPTTTGTTAAPNPSPEPRGKIPGELAALLALLIGVFYTIAAPPAQLFGRLAALAVAVVLGVMLAFWADIPRSRVPQFARVLAAGAWMLLGFVECYSIVQTANAEQSIPLTASLIEDMHAVAPIETATPPPRASGVNYLPSDVTTFNRIHHMMVKRGFRVGSMSAVLRLTLRNEGKAIWSTYKVALKAHYEMRSAVDWWDIADHVDQDVPISNCQFGPGRPEIPLTCDGTQIRPGETYDLTIVNNSGAYAVIEFPETIEFQEPGNDSIKRGPLNVAGRDMIFPTKIRQVILPPFRAPGDPT